ncbi:AraC family transcriptional regulator [Actibacterium sp. XHP0104]|uniref:AraC family transcriptional regulator n=1 Tax=Actibacterium sp. XHP0104 TaxID=2984335 RepID=UPI0021E800F8|nr:AraC family transcriptional regulator [Actibacterium sp. XHP0104]MCV2882144.1 AraC family transcriptional regulator [Actibacterium sp. XHP0104]
MLDLLSDILTRLSVRGTLYFRTSLSEPWGIKVPHYENVARFHYAHRGDCQVRVHPGMETISLEQGDLILIPHGAMHDLYCKATPPDQVFPLEKVLEKSGYDGRGVLVYGGDANDREVQLICGHFSFAPFSRHVLLDRLPPLIHIRNYGENAGPWLETSLRMIGSEAGGARLGGDLIALKLSEAIFAQAIRTYLERQVDAHHPLAAFADPHISRALTAFHQAPAQPWSIQDLAREAALSRTVFAQLFSEKMGMTPMQYITSWRMQIAREGLAGHKLSVADVAEKTGYSSESSFSRVFQKEVGMRPAAFRKAARA